MNEIILTEDDQDVLLLDRRSPKRIVEFLGVNFSPVTPDILLARVVQKAKIEQSYGYLVTPNADHLVRLHDNMELMPYYENAWLNTNDSRILELLAKMSGIELPACPGSDLAARLFEKIIKPNDAINIIGGDKALIDVLKAKYSVRNVKWYDAPMGLSKNPEEIRKCAQFIAENPALFHFICVGSPQQEMIAKAVLEFENAKGVGLCLGASLEFITGRVKRAPEIMQKLRLEWLHRLFSEPKRMWKRYLVEGPKIFLIWFKWHKKPI